MLQKWEVARLVTLSVDVGAPFLPCGGAETAKQRRWCIGWFGQVFRFKWCPPCCLWTCLGLSGVTWWHEALRLAPPPGSRTRNWQSSTKPSGGSFRLFNRRQLCFWMQDAHHPCAVPQRGWWAGQDWRSKKDQSGPWFVWPGTLEIISSKNVSKTPSEKSLPENSCLGRSVVCYFSSFIFATKGRKWVCSLHLGFLAFPVNLTHVTPAISLALWPRWEDNGTRCVPRPLALWLRSALGAEWRRAALGRKLLPVSHTRFPVVPTQGT